MEFWPFSECNRVKMHRNIFRVSDNPYFKFCLPSHRGLLLRGKNFLFYKRSLSFNYQKAEDKTSVCKFSKIVKSKLYHIENSKTRGQKV